MDNRLKRKYLKKARVILRKKQKENDYTSTTELPGESATISSQDVSIHVETNKELKRLLLASVGSDLEQQIENLIAEKTRLQSEVGRSFSRLNSIVEETDHLSVECDIWRSKFLASRVMIDELLQYKNSSSTAYAEFVRSLNALLGERQTLGRHVAQCNTMLQRCLMHLNKADGLFVNGHGGNIVDVASINTRATKQLLETLITNPSELSHPAPSSAHSQDIFDVSFGEELAQKALSSSRSLTEKKPNNTTVLLPHLSVGERHLLQRTTSNKEGLLQFRHHQSEFLWAQESISLHYCRNCRGKILLV